MRYLYLACCAALMVSMAVGAQANFVTNPGFEINAGAGSVPASWSVWTQRGGAIGVEAGSIGAPVGNWVAAAHTANLNGGFYQSVVVPMGVPLKIDGYWASHPTAAGSQWGEVIVFDGLFVPLNGQDVNPPGQGTQNGLLADGELIYKNDTWATPNGWSGQISATAPVTNNGPNIGVSNTGILTIILKAGNIGGPEGVDFDNITVVPEPSSLLALAGGLAGMAGMIRRKR